MLDIYRHSGVRPAEEVGRGLKLQYLFEYLLTHKVRPAEEVGRGLKLGI